MIVPYNVLPYDALVALSIIIIIFTYRTIMYTVPYVYTYLYVRRLYVT